LLTEVGHEEQNDVRLDRSAKNWIVGIKSEALLIALALQFVRGLEG
jgi:hypothetical protein